MESNTLNLFIRKQDDSHQWECGYMIEKEKKKLGTCPYIRQVECIVDSFAEAEQWLEEKGKLNVS